MRIAYNMKKTASKQTRARDARYKQQQQQQSTDVREFDLCKILSDVIFSIQQGRGRIFRGARLAYMIIIYYLCARERERKRENDFMHSIRPLAIFAEQIPKDKHYVDTYL